MKTKTFAYAMIILAGIIYTLGIQAFLQEAKIFPTGLGAFVTIITYSADFLKSYFSIIYLALNIPLIIIFWKKVKKQFTYRTVLFLFTQAVFGSLFLIPEIGNPIRSVFNGFKPFRIDDATIHRASGWPIIIMSIIAALLSGFGIALAWKYGGSSGGTDIITYYYSTKKQKSIGKIAMIIGVIIAIFSFSVILGIDKSMRSLWYITLISTFLYIFIVSWMIDWYFPKYSKVKISIHSTKSKEIIKYLSSSEFTHAFYINKVHSGYLDEDKEVIESVILLLELRNLSKNLEKIDPDIWFSIENIRQVRGKFITDIVE